MKQKHNEAREDFYDVLTAHLRANEPRESLTSVKKRLGKLGNANRKFDNAHILHIITLNHIHNNVEQEE